MTDALRRAFDPRHFYEVPSATAAQAPLPSLLQRYSLVTGHFTMEQVQAVLGHTFVFTFLREPVDRVISLYYFYRQQTGEGRLDPRVAHAQALDFEPFVAQLPDRVSPWSNWQTYVFSGAAHCDASAEELLPAAIENLARLDFVGIQDALTEGLASLAELRKWPLVPAAERVNVTLRRESADRLASAAVARLRDLNRCDAKLFEVAAQRWKSDRGRRNGAEVAPVSARMPFERREMGTRDVIITAADVLLDQRRITVHAHSRVAVDDLTIGIRITDEHGGEVHGTNTKLQGLKLQAAPDERVEVMFTLDKPLAPGQYFLTIAAHRGADHLEGCFHWVDNAVRFAAH